MRGDATPHPDLAILLVAAVAALADRMGEAQRVAGIDGVRPAYAFAIRALAPEPLPLARLAELLGITKQAAAQTVDAMESEGFLTRRADPADGRRKLLELTELGHRVRSTALAASAELEAELEREHGAAAVRALREVLAGMVERGGGLEDLRASRARLVVP